MLTDKAPYIVTIVIAGIAWTIAHMADRLLSTPMVKYNRTAFLKGWSNGIFDF